MSGDSMMRIGEVRELEKITREYWDNRQDTGTRTFIMSADVIENITDSHSVANTISGGLNSAISKNFQFSLRGGRFQLKR